jgi:hypothetical protein
MEPLEVVDMFLDGERVDPDELKNALAQDEGRQYLVDVLRLREATPSRSHVLETPPARKVVVGSRAALAAAILVSLVAGYVAGAHDPVQAPAPAAAAIEPAAPAPVIPAAPAPTTVIKLEPGVDWNESAGG